MSKNKKKKSVDPLRYDADDTPLWAVECIRDKKWFVEEKKYKYLIKWRNFTDEDNTWEPIENLDDMDSEIDNFEEIWKEKEI